MSSKKGFKPNKGGGKFNHPKRQGATNGSGSGPTANTRPTGGMDAVGRKGGRGFDLTELSYPESDDDRDDDEEEDGRATTFNDAGICGWKAGAEKK